MAAAHPQPLRIGRLDWTPPHVLLLAMIAARGGDATDLLACCQSTTSPIPHSRVGVESLNVAVAAAPLLIGSRWRQQQEKECRLLAANAPL